MNFYFVFLLEHINYATPFGLKTKNLHAIYVLAGSFYALARGANSA